MRTITLKLPEPLLERLDRAAASSNTTRSALVRAALEEVLANVEFRTGSCFDLASDLFGSIKGLPADLATNPRHMECFGR